MARALFFGCWNDLGHHLFAPNKQKPSNEERRLFDLYGSNQPSLDSNYAPRYGLRKHVRGIAPVWQAQGKTIEERRQIEYASEEFPQGQFLRHTRDGWTLISWWDRNQGDKRGACNSTFLLEGEHSSEQMLVALAEHFPHVLANLKRAGVELVEVVPV